MLKIIAINISKEKKDDYYRCFVDREYKFTFTSQRKAIQFERTANKFYNEHLLILNELVAQIYSVYRKFYPFIDNRRDSKQLSNSFNDIDTHIDFIFHKNVGANKTTFFHTKLMLIYLELRNICMELQLIAREKRQTSIDIQVRSLKILVQQSELEYKAYNIDISNQRITDSKIINLFKTQIA